MFVDVSGTHNAYIFRAVELDEQEATMKKEKSIES
jgi:hypothetical protein